MIVKPNGELPPNFCLLGFCADFQVRPPPSRKVAQFLVFPYVSLNPTTETPGETTHFLADLCFFARKWCKFAEVVRGCLPLRKQTFIAGSCRVRYDLTQRDWKGRLGVEPLPVALRYFRNLFSLADGDAPHAFAHSLHARMPDLRSIALH